MAGAASAARASRFLFSRSFDTASDVVPHAAPEAASADGLDPDAPRPDAGEPEPPPPLRHTDADLERVRAEAHAAGRSEGEVVAASQRTDATEQRLAAALETVAESLGAAASAATALEATWTSAAARAALEVVRKVVPTLQQRHAADEVLALFRDVLDGAVEPASLTVAMPADVRDAVAGPLTDIAESRGFAGRLTVAGDPNLQPGDCRVTWAGGGAVRDTAAVWANVEAAVARLIGEPCSGVGEPAAEAADPLPSSV